MVLVPALLFLFVSVLNSLAFQLKFNIRTNSIYSISKLYDRTQLLRLNTNSNSNSDGKNNNNNENPNRPPVIPFDFARDDIPLKPKDSDMKKSGNSDRNSDRNSGRQTSKIVARPVDSKERIDNKSNNNNNNNRNTDSNRNDNDDFYNARPTGYDTPDDDEDDEIIGDFPANYSVDGDGENDLFIKFLKDTYLDNPYDTRKKRQARTVIRNITGLSIAIGIVFTAVWYLFPGKFISIRGDTNFQDRYQNYYVDPDNLLKSDSDNYNYYYDDNSNSNTESLDKGTNNQKSDYFDDAKGLPEQEQTRFLPEKKPTTRLAEPSVDL